MLGILATKSYMSFTTNSSIPWYISDRYVSELTRLHTVCTYSVHAFNIEKSDVKKTLYEIAQLSNNAISPILLVNTATIDALLACNLVNQKFINR